MARVPKAISKLIESFEKLPGIGPKTAQRLTFYLLHVPQNQLESFAQSLSTLKTNTVLCTVCKNVGEEDPCYICSDPTRDQKTIMVVEQALDVLALERTGKYKGLYHVLHGAINPLENIGPEEIFISELVGRAKGYENGDGGELEIILATNPTMEGNATAMYLASQLKTEDMSGAPARAVRLKISRLGLGLPTGADLEYADDTTLTQAIEGRRSF